jgi:acyl-CoA thioesterase-1
MSRGSVSRRALLAATASLVLAPAAPALAAAVARVAILGDSITAGYGLPAPQALPARLQAELARLGDPVRVIAAGVSGDTTAGGVRRVDRAVPAGVRVCVVALGGNDLLNGEDPARVRANLARIVRRLKARGVTVVLAGLRVPPLLDGGYARAFDAAFEAVARTSGVIFLPDMLAGIALNPALNQRDGIHPNAAGVQVIARRLAPLVARALRGR